MASFYGNMKNNSRASFIFDKIYPSRAAMEAALNATDSDGTFIGDGIFINRYVLIDYHYALADTDTLVSQNNIDEFYQIVDKNNLNESDFYRYFIRTEANGEIKYVHPTGAFSPLTEYYEKKVFIDRYKPDNKIVSEEAYVENMDSDNQSITNLSPFINSLVETDIYYAHKKADWEAYRANYDCTVWMKIYIDGKERYIMVAELNAEAPVLEIIDDAPDCYNGSAHFDARASTDLNYLYYIPRNWNIVMNQYNPNYTIFYNNDNNNEYYYYERNKSKNALWYEQYIPTTDTTVQYSKDYYSVTHTEVTGLNVGETIKNLHYYEKDNDNYVATLDQMVQPNKTYYIRSVNRLSLRPGTDISTAGYYEENNRNKTYDDDVEYPYFNRRGFDKRVSVHVNDIGQGMYINKVASTQTYPQHRFVHAGALTKDTFLPNRYYTYNGDKLRITNLDTYKFSLDVAYYIGKTSNPTSFKYISLSLDKNGNYRPTNALQFDESYYYDKDLEHVDWFVKSTEWQQNTAYYELTWATKDGTEAGEKIVDHDNDTYRVDMYFPEFGNAVADIYDTIYGAPVIQDMSNANGDQYNNFIGYCSAEQWASYTQDENGDYWAGNRVFNLTDEQFNELSPEFYPGLYDIPVYLKAGSNVRLYNDERMRSTLAPPYDNLNNGEDISVGWALTLLKRYLSELRYLSYGANGTTSGQGIGLQSDWTLNDDEAFGYIYHRPNIIVNFTLTSDTEAIPDKDYYIESVKNGEVIYTKVENLAPNTPIANAGYYELPRQYLNDIERNKDIYTQCTDEDIYDAEVQYFILENSRYVPAYWTDQSNSLNEVEITNDNEPGVENGLVSYQNEYIITKSNDVIVNRKYGCLVGSSADSIALCYNGKAIQHFYIEVNSEDNSTNAILIDDIQDIKDKNRYQILDFLNNIAPNIYNTDYDDYGIWIYRDSEIWPENSNLEDFCYARIESQKDRIDLTSTIFNNHKTYFYIKNTSPMEKEDYEIHNIWNSVLRLVVQEP